MLKRQNRQKLRGELHIKDRLVSLDELQARPIKKGKAFPDCEFGSTWQMSFNRQGFMITTEVLEGKPADSDLYQRTLKHYQRKMRAMPPGSVTDKGFRSAANRKHAQGLAFSCFGKISELEQQHQDFCKSARSATEGFIATAKHLRGLGKSLYRGLDGDKIWVACGQAAYNLKKFYALWKLEQLKELTLQKLAFIT